MMTHIGMFEEARLIKKLRNQVREAQGKLSIIKAIGNNSPKMKLLQKEIEALKQQLYTDDEKSQKRIKELMEINNEHQQINGKLNSELEIEKKNHTLTREGLELEVRMKDREIGRMMKKLQ